jgi:hypothetical protein
MPQSHEIGGIGQFCARAAASWRNAGSEARLMPSLDLQVHWQGSGMTTTQSESTLQRRSYREPSMMRGGGGCGLPQLGQSSHAHGDLPAHGSAQCEPRSHSITTREPVPPKSATTQAS